MMRSLHDDDHSMPCSSGYSNTEDDRMIAIILSEEYARMDGAVSRQVSGFAPVNNIPWIRTFIPEVREGGHDHQLLIHRLNAYGLIEVKVSGDGNCQFRAISDQIFKSPENHKFVRKEIVKQLKDHRSFYEGYVPMRFKKYCKKMSKSGEWGDHITLQAAADKFAVKIRVLTSFRDTCFIEISPQYAVPQREIWLSLWSEVHYNSLYANRDVPVREKSKKKYWLF